MAAMKEQIAQHSSAQTTQQQLPDDLLAPKPIRFPQQQALLTQAYPPDYEDEDLPDTRPPRSAMRYQGSTGGKPCSQLPRSSCAASVSPGMLPVNSLVLPDDAAGTGRCIW